MVALNAAGKVGTAASFYLPLDRVKRAVDLIKRGEPVSRGTLQATFEYKYFNDLQRLGLPADVETRVRNSSRHSGSGSVVAVNDNDAGAARRMGMLVVKSVVPGGPAMQGKLLPGDVLVSLDGELVTYFPDLEAMLDDRSGSEKGVTVEVLRGGVLKRLAGVEVQDLHAVSPSSFLEMGDSIFHDLSYHQARNHEIPLSEAGAYVAQSGYMLRRAGIAAGSLIQAVGNVPTPNAAALERALAALPSGERVPVRYKHVSNRTQSAIAVMRVDKTWFPVQRFDLGPGFQHSPSQPDEAAGHAWKVPRRKIALEDDTNFDWRKSMPLQQRKKSTPPSSSSRSPSFSSSSSSPSPSPSSFASSSSASSSAAAATANGSSKMMARFPPGSNAAERSLSRSLAHVRFSMPYMIDVSTTKETWYKSPLDRFENQ